jgi:hypothetical protein
VGDPIARDGILQRPDDMILADHIIECLRAPFSGYDLVR